VWVRRDGGAAEVTANNLSSSILFHNDEVEKSRVISLRRCGEGHSGGEVVTMCEMITLNRICDRQAATNRPVRIFCIRHRAVNRNAKIRAQEYFVAIIINGAHIVEAKKVPLPWQRAFLGSNYKFASNVINLQ